MSSSASGSGSKPDNMEDMMKRLGITENDLDDVIFEDEKAPAVEAIRWMAVARIHTPEAYNQYWFFRNMRAAWDLVQEVKIRALEENLYSIKFF
ncbi:hypothetical protein D1007_02052 [Hordeum vulgare]|nr:hypothetical protein D1007_02052 [Hordeum vulgare]